jgi:hypothetical protein
MRDKYQQAAEAICTAICEEFEVRPKRDREETIKALVGIMKHFLEPKTAPAPKPPAMDVKVSRRTHSQVKSRRKVSGR